MKLLGSTKKEVDQDKNGEEWNKYRSEMTTQTKSIQHLIKSIIICLMI